jgi:hypothetical protein
MAGMTATVTYDDGVDGKGERCRLRRVLIDFLTDDAAGTATVTTRKIVGELVKIVTDPGSAAPDANWDVIVTDGEGVNVLGKCMNAATLLTRHTSNTEETYLYLQEASVTPVGIGAFPVVCDALTVALANAGNAKTTQIIIYYRV